MRLLVRPELPEPIDDAQWRRLYRLGVGVPLAFALFNVACVLFVHESHRPAFFRFLAVTLPTHFTILLISVVNLKWRAGDRIRRGSAYLLIPLVELTSIPGMFMDEAMEGNSVLVLVAIAFFRVAFDGRLGLFAFLSAGVLQATLWTLVGTGVLPAMSAITQRPPRAQSSRFILQTLIWQLVAYAVAWVLASYVANRFRALSHAAAREREAARKAIAAIANAGHGRLTGQILSGRYFMKELLGRGGMGEVYDAVCIDDSRAVAIKILFPHLEDSPRMLERFKREATAVRRLTSSCAAEVLDSGVEDNGSPYIVMERLRGEDLATMLRRRGPLPLDEMCRLLERLARALDVVHTQGIIHRDLKPSNIFILENGDARLLDFGIARLLDTPTGETLTGDNTVIGSPGFLAPEQARGASDEIGPWTDVFALGAITYRAITGQSAFPSSTAAEAIFAALERQPPPPSSLRADLPAQLDQVLARALAKAPRQRYARSITFADDFALACRGALTIT